MKRGFKILVAILAIIGALNVSYLVLALIFPREFLILRYPERYWHLEEIAMICRDTPLLSEIDHLKKRLLEESPEQIGLLPVRGADDLTFALPRELIPPSLPPQFRFVSKKGPVDALVVAGAEAFVHYGADRKPEHIEFFTFRVSIFVQFSPGTAPSEYTTAMRLSESPLVYACFH